MIVLANALYWVAIGVLCFAGSALVAGVLRRHGRQERGIWATGLVAALALPLVLPRVGAEAVSPTATGGGIGPVGVIDLAPMRVAVADAPDFGWVAPALLAAWVALSALLLFRFVSATRTVARVRSRAQPAPAHGERVRVTEADGPAVAGFLRPIILIPSWVLQLSGSCRDWILRHEEEHIRGRDPILLGFVLIARVAVPWNPVVWLFDRSIRSAIETDCDRRTVAPGGDVHAYSEALLAVASGRSSRPRLPAMAPAFAERRVPLDHRIETVTTPRRRVGTAVRLGIAAVSALVIAAACEMPAPTESDPGPDPTTAPPAAALEDAGTGVEGVDSPTDEDGPRFIAYDVAPRLTNASEVAGALEREYPPLLKEAGIGGEVIVWLYIDEEGKVAQSRIRSEPPGTSGHDALDAAALSVADEMEFTPAQNRDKVTAVWVQIPITFTVAGADERLTDRPVDGSAEGSDEVPPPPGDVDAPEFEDRPVDDPAHGDTAEEAPLNPDQPRFIPYDVAPRLQNADEVRQVLEREYPPLLKESGIGGEVIVWLYIDENGRVAKSQIRAEPAGTSGYEALDAAALAVADAMDFTPAKNRDRATPVWVQIPITFTVGN